MIAINKFGFKAMLAGAILACLVGQAAQASVDVSGVKFEDTTKLAGKDLKLNGAGMRTKFFVKVYAAALYLTEKKNNAADIMKIAGPRRVTLVMMRDISAEEFGDKFMKGLNENTTQAEKNAVLSQTMQFGEMFALLPGLKKGDVLHLDWVPGSGTMCQLNEKKIGEVVPDIVFYNALLRIWIGDKPADRSLKPKLLGDDK